MTELLTSAQMRAIEQAAIDSGAVTGLELMERAGRGVVEAIFAEWPELAGAHPRAVVLCGPGNNGGDGFVIARLLKARGWEVETFLYGDPDRLPPDARANLARWRALGPVRRLSFPDLDAADAEALRRATGSATPGDPPLLIDALFGTGLTRPIRGLEPFLELTRRNRTVAVDIPSGISADTGAIAGADDPRLAVRADLTVSFHRRKIGHARGPGARLSGHVVVADIGL